MEQGEFSKNEKRAKEELFVFVLAMAFIFTCFYTGWITIPNLSSPKLGTVSESTTKELPPSNEVASPVTFALGDTLVYYRVEGEMGWQGIVKSIKNDSYELEVIKVTPLDEASFLPASPCSGGEQLDRQSIGTLIRVPGSCLEIKRQMSSQE